MANNKQEKKLRKGDPFRKRELQKIYPDPPDHAYLLWLDLAFYLPHQHFERRIRYHGQ